MLQDALRSIIIVAKLLHSCHYKKLYNNDKDCNDNLV